MTTVDVLQIILSKYPEICAVAVSKFVYVEQFSEQITDTKGVKIVEKARRLKQEQGVPFNIGLMLKSVNNDEWSLNALSACTHHNDIQSETICSIQTNIHKIQKFANDKEQGWSLCSFVDMTNVHLSMLKNIPMLDFHIAKSDVNTEIVCNVCKLLGLPGYVLDSGKSYHFIGTELIDFLEMYKFLGKSLMFTPIVDERWVAHQLQYGFCNLRLTEKYGKQPQVIREINI